MGREKDAKGEEGKAKHKATKLKKLSDYESAGAGGDAIKIRWVVCVCVRKVKMDGGEMICWQAQFS